MKTFTIFVQLNAHLIFFVIIVAITKHSFTESGYNTYTIKMEPQYIHYASVDLFHRFKLLFL